MAKRRDIDWTAVEADFRAGRLSNRQIAKKHDVSESAIRKRADTGEWARTTGGKSAHRPQGAHLPTVPARKAAPALPSGDHAALARDIAYRQLTELNGVTAHVGEIEAAILAETEDDPNDRRRAAMLKAVSLPSRAMTLKTITQALAVMKEVDGQMGKKEAARAKADEASKPGNKFAPPAPPKLVVDNRK